MGFRFSVPSLKAGSGFQSLQSMLISESVSSSSGLWGALEPAGASGWAFKDSPRNFAGAGSVWLTRSVNLSRVFLAIAASFRYSLSLALSRQFHLHTLLVICFPVPKEPFLSPQFLKFPGPLMLPFHIFQSLRSLFCFVLLLRQGLTA